MKVNLSVYKRKIYVPKNISEFPDKGEVTALVGSAAILIIFKDDSELVKKDVKYFSEVINGVQ